MTKELVIDLIQPKSELEIKLLNDSNLIEGLMYGKPRKGHPEGEVIYHVVKVINNIHNKFDCGLITMDEMDTLRIIAIIHDSFKYRVDRTIPRSGENHHGMIARYFAAKYIDDMSILTILELHDEAYNAWQKGNRGNWKGAEERANKLITILNNVDCLHLFIHFYQSDNNTGDKMGDDYHWFNVLLHKLKLSIYN